MPVAEANFFAIVIAIQQKSGGNLSEALGNLSSVLRERRKMSDKIKADEHGGQGLRGDHRRACRSPWRSLTYLSSPDYISLLWTTQIGKISLVIGGRSGWRSASWP